MAKQNKGRKFFAASATAALVASAIVPVASAAQVNDYNKISGYAKEAVQSLVDQGVIQGDTNGNFNPLNTVTRAQAAEIFTKALELEADGEVNFKDVKAGAWYYNSIAAVVANGIFEGVSATEFAPNKSLTRSEAAKVLVDAFGLEGSESLGQFADASQVKPWAKSALETAVANGIFTGSEENGKLNLKPNAAITRQDFAVVFARTLDLVDAETPADASVKAINNTTVEVTFDEEVHADDVKAGDFKIDGLEVTNAAVKQTNKKVVVLTTAAQTADKEYVVSYDGKEIGKFKGVAAVIPTKIDVTTSSLQGIIGKEVTLKAQVTVAEGQSKANIPVTFNIVSDNANVNSKIEVEALTDENGVATYSYTRYYEHNDNFTAYATSKSSVASSGKVYWANKTQLAVSEITTGNELANNAKKSYKVVGAKNTTYYIAIKENLNVAPDKITNVYVQDHNNTNNFVIPYELTTGSDQYAKVQTNSDGEATFTVYGSNLSATPIVYLPSSVNKSATDYSYSKLALQTEAPTVKFSQVDKLAINVVAEGTADSAEFLNVPVAYDQNSVGGRTYTVTVTDKDGKIAPEGTTAYVAFEDGNISGDVYFSTAKDNFSKVAKGDIKAITVGKEGKAQFRVAGKGATSFVKPTVFLNTAGKATPAELDKTDVQKVADVTYFKAPVVSNATLKVTDLYGRTVTSLEAGKDAYFTYQSVDQNGFDYRPTGYNTTGQTTQIVWKPVTQPDGSIVWVQEVVTNPGNIVYEYVLAFDVQSTFGNAVVKDAAGTLLNPSQNLGNMKTYQVKSDATGKAIVRVTSQSADTVSVNVTGASNILPSQTASISFTNSAAVPSLYTGVVESFDSVKQTLKFAGKNEISYVGAKVNYRNVNNLPIDSADTFAAELAKATGTVQVTYEVKDGVTTFYIVNVATTGTAPVDKAPVPTIAYTAINGTVGTAITPVTPSVTGLPNGATLTYSATLPAGLAIDPATGVISGTPTTAQAATTVNVNASFTNAAGLLKTVTSPVSITVAAAPLTDAQKLDADKGLIEAGTYEIPKANQADQAAKTAWVQSAVDAKIANGTSATVTWNAGTSKYDVALKLNAETGSATILVTEAP